MLRFCFYILVFFSIPCSLWSQSYDLWVFFKDKPQAEQYLLHPEEMLSQRALDRRQRYQIPIDDTDVPIFSNYIDQVAQIDSVDIIAHSKWLNGLHLRASESSLQQLENLESIKYIELLGLVQENPSKNNQNITDKLAVTTSENYGAASHQIKMLNGQFLHDKGYTGQGMQIAVIDAGFIKVDSMGAFSRLRDNNQILGTYNFIDKTTDVYTRHYHGTMVLSTLAAYIDNEYTGTAPDASYYLFISEDTSQEHPYEESLWIEAAEKADSLGVDIITTSLGYTEFDNPDFNHTYSDLDGNTTIISRGSKIATEKGMLLVNSAGNWGTKSWRYIGAPADVANVLSVGAVDKDSIIAPFSSWGYTADGRVKPDVCAQGVQTALVNPSNEIVTGSGTSFAAPIIAGLTACLWQAFRDQKPGEIRKHIKQSANMYNNPDEHYGYGIPDFKAAYFLLHFDKTDIANISVFPNPVKRGHPLQLIIPENLLPMDLHMYDIRGQLIQTYMSQNSYNTLDTGNYAPGFYLIQATNTTHSQTFKIIID
ncbi:MAG: peptidase S8 [Flavobacteriia bacterium]|nr:MAG: peptidase S8 [Flavobacteriia bacterium]